MQTRIVSSFNINFKPFCTKLTYHGKTRAIKGLHNTLSCIKCHCTCLRYKSRHCKQGVIQDFEVEGGNEKSNQKMLLKKGQLLFQYPAMDTQS